MTHPGLDTAPSGAAADAVRTLQAELSAGYSEIRSAEVQLTEAILSAHAVTVSGRTRLQDIQRQLVEAITDPVAALDTPAGERHFLMFLRAKIAEIQAIVDAGALTDEDHARLTRALGSGYLLSAPERADGAPDFSPGAPAGGAPTADQAAGMGPALGSALGSLPAAAQGAAAAPAQGAGGLAGAASPLAGLASGLLGREGAEGDEARADDGVDGPLSAGRRDADATDEDEDDEDAHDSPTDDERPDQERPDEPREPDQGEPPKDGPAPTRPARLL